MSEIEIRRLGGDDAPALNRLLTADPAEYRRYFHFAPEVAAAESILTSAVEDRYWGISVEPRDLAALVMLRGIDEGFLAPAFGVYVAQAWSGRGLATLALRFAETWCRVNGCSEIMLTVHPDHAPARHMYERDGFRFSGEHSQLGYRIYRKSLR